MTAAAAALAERLKCRGPRRQFAHPTGMQRHRCYALALIGQLFNPRSRDARGSGGRVRRADTRASERDTSIQYSSSTSSTQAAGSDRENVSARSCVRSRAVAMVRPAEPLPIGTENGSKNHESCTNTEKIVFGEMIHVKANVFSLSINKNSALLSLSSAQFDSRSVSVSLFRNASKMKN